MPILYLAPWVDLGGSDKATIDWFKQIDRERWAPSIITTQPSENRWLPLLEPYAEEIWALPDLMPGSEFPSFILGFIESRGVELVHIMNSRLGFDLMPDMRCLPDPPAVVVQLHAEEPDRSGYVRYVASRYGNLVDAFSTVSQQLADAMLDYDVARSRLHVIRLGVDAQEEFNPDRVVPFELPGDSSARILWPGRLVAQKDPLLTLEVIEVLQARGVDFMLHIVGEGDLKDDAMRRARELRVEHLIDWNPTIARDAALVSQRGPAVHDEHLRGSALRDVRGARDGRARGRPRIAGQRRAGRPGRRRADRPPRRRRGLRRRDPGAAERRSPAGKVGEEARERMIADYSVAEMGARHERALRDLLARRAASPREDGDRVDRTRRALTSPSGPTTMPRPVSFPATRSRSEASR